MMPIINQRIEQIRRGEVPEGYSSTPAGILPKDWSYAKLKDVSEVITETVGERSIETVSISAGVGFVNQADKFGKELSGNQYVKYTVLHKGDFAYNKGNSNRYPQGCIYMLKDRDVAAVPNVFECFQIREGVPEYYEQLFIGGFLNKQLARLINHGVRDDGLLNLTDKDFYSVSLPVPPISEQQKIAKILTDYDRAIELKQKMIDELKKLKKVCLAKMFPKEGETVPKIRFPEFTAPWGQRKLGEIGEVVTGSTPSTEHPEYYSEYGIPWVTPTDITGNLISDTPRKLSPLGAQVGRVVPAETILVTCIASIGKNTMLANTGSFNQQINGLVPNKQEYDPYFLLTESYHWSAKMKREAAAGTMQIVNKNEFSSIKTTVPNLPEQKAIGDYFRRLDNLITLHQCELEQMQQKKRIIMKLLLTGIIRVK